MEFKKLFALALMSSSLLTQAQDWKNTPVPADPGQGKKWELQKGYSDDFNYNGKNAQFRSNWRDAYFHSWTGPGLTQWQSDHSDVKGGNLIISASRHGANRVNCGVVTSKTKVIYPIFMEARIKVSNLELSSNFWMLSEDDKREIDVLEVYGGASDVWFAQRMSTNFHVFERGAGNRILSDYNDQNHVTLPNNELWRNKFHTFGVYWKSPSEVYFYIDGKQTKDGSWAQSDMFDKDYTRRKMDKNRFKMDKPVFMIIDTEDHSWRSEQGIVASDADLKNPNKNKMLVDWVRTYKPVKSNDTKPTPKPDPVVVNPGSGSNTKPNLNFVSPKNNATLARGKNIEVAINASDNDGIANVKLYLNNKFVRQENVTPYTWGETNQNDGILKNMKSGNYTLKAVATDKKGATSEKVIRFTVTNGTVRPTRPTPVNNNQLVANGLYSIKNPFEDQAVLARELENYNAQMVDVGSYTDQQWIFTHLGNNVYTIKNSRNNRYLEVPFGGCGNGENVSTWREASQNHQKWKVIKNGRYYALMPLHCTAQALDRAGGLFDANLITWAYNPSNNNQKWEINGTAKGLKVLGDTDARTFEIYPNPAQVDQSVTISGIALGQVAVVYNVAGQVVKTVSEATTETLVVDVTGLSAGMYFVKVGNQAAAKLIIE
ncbi:Ig-like domain-containing protein [Aquimarina agarilytica]|uniref:Ig-like domain-containing protein n=1 Tax=Aquimarina agarilytica TaxID=1087449 RepID=UPI0002889B01|nr:RICIN domain-containing protein [Aquimarina agarilytica]